MSQIRIAQWPQPIEAGRSRILDAALDAGVPYPHGCGTGECGGCKTRLVSGNVTMESCSPDALSEQERANGVILACRARPIGDVQVRWLSSTAPLPILNLTTRVAEKRWASRDVVVLTLKLPAGTPFAFRPGQFAKLRVASLPARSYSMASQPGSEHVEFHIRVVDHGLVSPNIAYRVQIGDKVQLQGPFGDACWNAEDEAFQGPLLLLAGGTGLAPILSVLDAALADGFPADRIHLYHGVRNERDLYAQNQLRARMRTAGFRFDPVLSECAVDTNGRHGLLHEALAEDYVDLTEACLHVAGSPHVVDAVRDMALRLGAAKGRIRADGFFAAEPARKSLWQRLTARGGHRVLPRDAGHAPGPAPSAGAAARSFGAEP